MGFFQDQETALFRRTDLEHSGAPDAITPDQAQLCRGAESCETLRRIWLAYGVSVLGIWDIGTYDEWNGILVSSSKRRGYAVPKLESCMHNSLWTSRRIRNAKWCSEWDRWQRSDKEEFRLLHSICGGADYATLVHRATRGDHSRPMEAPLCNQVDIHASLYPPWCINFWCRSGDAYTSQIRILSVWLRLVGAAKHMYDRWLHL